MEFNELIEARRSVRKYVASEMFPGFEGTRSMVRRYSRMGIPIVLFFDALPVALLAIATFRVWRVYI